MKLVNISSSNFNVELDIKYATLNNFTGQKIYKSNDCFLIEDAANNLLKAIELASDINLKIKIYDGYRPPYAQQKMWDFNPDPNFLSNPQKGSPHSRGIAIDLTLLNESGAELNMGTSFDEFSEKSHHNSRLVNKDAKKNRHILLSIMTIAGFDFYMNEWWHYQLFNPKKYPIINLES